MSSAQFKRAKKSLGQNFLTDPNIQKKIVNSLGELDQFDEIVEIGPGRGALTEHLINSGRQIIAIEFDRALAEFWREKESGSFKLIHSDFLKLDFDQTFDKNLKRAFIGNIPYNITSPILFKLMEHLEHFNRAVLMMQKEVAERLSATPGTKDHGILSVLCGYNLVIKKLFTVPPTVFTPKPKVDSAVVVIEPLKSKSILARDESFFKEIVKRAFNQRRKMLRVSLKSYLSDYDGELDLTRRPEQLSIDEFVQLSNDLFKSQ